MIAVTLCPALPDRSKTPISRPLSPRGWPRPPWPPRDSPPPRPRARLKPNVSGVFTHEYIPSASPASPKPAAAAIVVAALTHGQTCCVRISFACACCVQIPTQRGLPSRCSRTALKVAANGHRLPSRVKVHESQHGAQHMSTSVCRNWHVDVLLYIPTGKIGNR